MRRIDCYKFLDMPVQMLEVYSNKIDERDSKTSCLVSLSSLSQSRIDFSNGTNISFSSSGKKRYSKLKRRIKGVTKKMLTQTLRQLERDGLMSRHVHNTVQI
jgi:hypothetical protein